MNDIDSESRARRRDTQTNIAISSKIEQSQDSVASFYNETDEREDLHTPKTVQSGRRSAARPSQFMNAESDIPNPRKELNDLVRVDEALKCLIKDQEWFNIPAPIRSTCEGIIEYQSSVTEAIIFTTEQSARKQSIVNEKQKKFENKTQRNFTNMDHKINELSARLTKDLKKFRDELKAEIHTNEEHTSRVSNALTGMKGQLEVWDGKIRRSDKKFLELRELNDDMEVTSNQQKKYFEEFSQKMKVLFEIPGIMGKKQDDKYTNFEDFVRKMHTFKSATIERIELRVLEEKGIQERELKRIERELLEYIKVQEQEVRSLTLKQNNQEDDISRLKLKTSQTQLGGTSSHQIASSQKTEIVNLEADKGPSLDIKQLSEKQSQELQQILCVSDTSSDKKLIIDQTPMPESHQDELGLGTNEQEAEGKIQTNVKIGKTTTQVLESAGGHMTESIDSQSDKDQSHVDKSESKMKQDKINDTQKKVTVLTRNSLRSEKQVHQISKGRTNDFSVLSGHAGGLNSANNDFAQVNSVMGYPHDDSGFSEQTKPLDPSSGTKVNDKSKQMVKPEEYSHLDQNVLNGVRAGIVQIVNPKATTPGINNLESQRPNRALKSPQRNNDLSELSLQVKTPVPQTSLIKRQNTQFRRESSIMTKQPVVPIDAMTKTEFDRRVNDLIHHQTKFESETAAQIDSVKQMLTSFSAAIWLQQRKTAKNIVGITVTEDKSSTKAIMAAKHDSVNVKSVNEKAKKSQDEEAVSKELVSKEVVSKKSVSKKDTKMSRVSQFASKADRSKKGVSSSASPSNSSSSVLSSHSSSSDSDEAISSSRQDPSSSQSRGTDKQASSSTSTVSAFKDAMPLDELLLKSKEMAQKYNKNVAQKYHFLEAYLNETLLNCPRMSSKQILSQSNYHKDHEESEHKQQFLQVNQNRDQEDSEIMSQSHRSRSRKGSQKSKNRKVSQKSMNGRLNSMPIDTNSVRTVSIKNSSIKTSKQNVRDCPPTAGHAQRGMMHLEMKEEVVVVESAGILPHQQQSAPISVLSENEAQKQSKAPIPILSNRSSQKKKTAPIAVHSNRSSQKKKTAPIPIQFLTEDSASAEIETSNVTKTSKNLQIEEVEEADSVILEEKEQLKRSINHLTIGSIESNQQVISKSKIASARSLRCASATSSHRKIETVNTCPKCRGESEKRPCVEWVDLLREEFTLHIESLFRSKMQEFIEFIEDYINLEDQIDPEEDNVIHAFYRKHNTLMKTHENFRLLEYKRKKYMEKRKQGNQDSPGRLSAKATNSNSPPQREIFTALNQAQTDPELTIAFQRFKMGGTADGTKQMYKSIQVDQSTRHGSAVTYERSKHDSTGQSTSIQTQHQMIGGSDHNEPRGRQILKNFKNNQANLDLSIISSAEAAQKRAKVNTNATRNRQNQARTSSMVQQRSDENRCSTTFREGKQQFPIISTRKAHLTIDQRVWESTEYSIPPANPIAELNNVPTLKLTMAPNSTESLNQNNQVTAITQPASRQQILLNVMNAEVRPKALPQQVNLAPYGQLLYPAPHTIKYTTRTKNSISNFNQDSSQSMRPQIDFNSLRQSKNATKPLTVQFQSLIPGKRN